MATVLALTRLEPLSARDAVLTDTPLRWATCRRPIAKVSAQLPDRPYLRATARTFPQFRLSVHLHAFGRAYAAYPVAFGFPVSHGPDNVALKIGAPYRLAVTAGEATLTES